MQQMLTKLIRGESLERSEAKMVMDEMMSGRASVAQMASLLTALRVKGETVNELIGFAEGMREHAVSVDLGDVSNAVDTCGTGGDGANTFNISTATAIIAAAAGVPVAKHGNRAASSQCGSADVLDSLGIGTDFQATAAETMFAKTGVCFLFAPLFHQAMKNVMPTRKELGFRTCFNLLGPLANPANVKRQLLGVFDPGLTETVAEVLAELGTERALVVSSYDGLDEITVTGKTRVSELANGQVKTYDLAPEQVGLVHATKAQITGGDPQTNATIIQHIFEGEKSAARDIVVFNAGAVLYIADHVASIEEGVRLAEQLLDEGKVKEKLTETIAVAEEVRRVS